MRVSARAQFLTIILLAVVAVMTPRHAHAACASPAGNIGQVIYNADNTVMQFCDGYAWHPMTSFSAGCSSSGSQTYSTAGTYSLSVNGSNMGCDFGVTVKGGGGGGNTTGGFGSAANGGAGGGSVFGYIPNATGSFNILVGGGGGAGGTSTGGGGGGGAGGGTTVSQAGGGGASALVFNATLLSIAGGGGGAGLDGSHTYTGGAGAGLNTTGSSGAGTLIGVGGGANAGGSAGTNGGAGGSASANGSTGNSGAGGTGNATYTVSGGGGGAKTGTAAVGGGGGGGGYGGGGGGGTTGSTACGGGGGGGGYLNTGVVDAGSSSTAGATGGTGANTGTAGGIGSVAITWTGATLTGATCVSGDAGKMQYNFDYHVLQFCNGAYWIAMGPSPGAGGSGCSNPTGAQGTIIYNREYQTPQYCDGAVWAAMYNNGLIHRWKLDEGTGTTTADSVGSDSGTLTNGPTWNKYGVLRSALTFDGANDYITMGDPVSGDLDFDATTSFTVSVWVYPTANVGAYDEPITKGGGSAASPGYDMELGSGAWGANVADGTTSVGAIFQASPTNNAWTHLVMVVDRTTNYLKVYVNGAYVTQSSIAGLGSLASATPFTIGANSNPAQMFQGKIDDVRVYNKALSANDIQSLYDSTRDVIDTNLIAWYRMEEGTGTTTADGAVTVHNATLSNGPTWTTRYNDANAILLDGNNDHIDVTYVSGTHNLSTDLSIMGWFRATAVPTATIQPLVELPVASGSGTMQYGLVLDPTAGLQFWLGKNPAPDVSISAPYNFGAGEWHFAAGTVSGTTMTLYLDGVAVQTGTFSGTRATHSSGDFYMGQYPGAGQYFNGALDEVRLYNRALTAAEIMQVYHATGGP